MFSPVVPSYKGNLCIHNDDTIGTVDKDGQSPKLGVSACYFGIKILMSATSVSNVCEEMDDEN